MLHKKENGQVQQAVVVVILVGGVAGRLVLYKKCSMEEE